MSTTSEVLTFLEMATAKVEGYVPSPNEQDSDRGDVLKSWLMCELERPIDIRTPIAHFKKIALSIGVEGGCQIKRGEIDPQDRIPESAAPQTLFGIPESGRELLGELYKEAAKILEGDKVSGKRARV